MSFNKDALIHKLQDENEMLRKLWAEWEDVPDEDLWQDGELKSGQVAWDLFRNVTETGEWRIIRRINK